jgi:formate hydrogenlyase subunit 3/multisubunit Na+/H+ antiporter MnhD subunit
VTGIVLLLLPIGVPLALVAAWLAALRWRGVPRWGFFATSVPVVAMCPVIGGIAQAVEDRGLSYECQTGVAAGVECGFGLARLAGYLAAGASVATLLVLAVASLSIHHYRARRKRAVGQL